ncbi:hypothetical protein [Chitinophaga niabensis]|uniref:Uncharacterized protein n=1 Tax=Chitinophaga niabensis TaxID=536979 RepID=A0A1N6JBJ8_9BACT|nr:hypothetical protein [Chitinophaga niabensis]SIO41718.1 hypothetical protein SAMN04488055_3837 [Chitinophaga niabensis]
MKRYSFVGMLLVAAAGVTTILGSQSANARGNAINGTLIPESFPIDANDVSPLTCTIDQVVRETCSYSVTGVASGTDLLTLTGVNGNPTEYSTTAD